MGAGGALVAATTINVPCTEACQTAEGGSCTCSCGGRNHSFADGVRVPYQSSASKAVAIDMHQWQHQSWGAGRDWSGKDTSRLMMLLHMRSLTTPQRLSEVEQHAVDTYTSPMYERINRALRADDFEALRKEKTFGVNKTAAAAVENLDDAILRGYVPQDTAVFRGLSGSFAEKLEVGDVITDAGYMSTTVDPTTAALFGHGHTMMMLEVPKGTPAASGNSAEYELVLSRGSSVEVAGFEAWQAANGDVVQVVKARLTHPSERGDRLAPEERTNVNSAFTKHGEFTAQEEQAIEAYSGMAADMNNLLRDPLNPHPELSSKDISTYLNMAVSLQQAIRKVETTRDLTVYRGTELDTIAGLQPGDTFNDRGFMSTSADRVAAERFGEATLVIELPAGSHALNEGSLNLDTDPTDENEIILPSDSRFTVTRRDGNTVYLTPTTAETG